jgi:hypothetical protein
VDQKQRNLCGEHEDYRHFEMVSFLKFKSFHLDIIWGKYYQLKLAFGKVLVASQFLKLKCK